MAAAQPGTFRVGLLGHGTVGAAFADLLPRQADRIARMTGLRPRALRCADPQPRLV